LKTKVKQTRRCKMSKLKPNQFILDGHLITERPILCQTEMVKAILEDRKTQTRRGFNQASYLSNESQSFRRMGFINGREDRYAAAIGTETMQTLHISKFGKPGDLLWVRETMAHQLPSQRIDAYMYKADYPIKVTEHKNIRGMWKPSIHMPKAASRIWLMIEDVSVERLQDISQEDAIAEGVELVYQSEYQKRWRRYDNVDGYQRTDNPYVSFWTLWESINGKESWDQNPWVWVIKFRVLSKTGRPSNAEILDSRLSVLASQKKEVSYA
jgi:hypothetical protein